MSQLNRNVATCVRGWVAEWPEEPDHETVERAHRFLSQWRSILLANTYMGHHGTRIYSGLFEGMDYVAATAEGALMPRLLGTYESELRPQLEALIAEAPDCVIDVGCAEGYYAVGLARLLPQATIYAHDIDPQARVGCGILAERNGVADRVVVGGAFRPQDFQAFTGRRTLVVVDIEGAEMELLRPDAAPALADMALVVETHGPGPLAAMLERFAPTHDIIRVDQAPKTFTPPPWLAELGHLDQLLAVWEWRRHPTPWLVMRPRTGWTLSSRG